MNGLYVGQLDAEERIELERLIASGEARIVYDGAAGFLGLGKVRIIPRSDQVREARHER